MTDKKVTEKELKNEIPQYRLSDFGIDNDICKDLFPMDLEELIFEKMYILFEKQEKANKDLEDAKVALLLEKENLLMNTDFKKETGSNRPTIAEKDAWMRPHLAKLTETVENCENTVRFYKNKIVIINDLIKMRRLQLRIEAALQE